MTERLEQAVAEAVPARSVETIASQNTRHGNETAYVTFADADPVYVKTATDTTVRLEREVAATQYAAAHCPVRVPPVVDADPTGEVPYLVTEPLPGTVLNDPWTDWVDEETAAGPVDSVDSPNSVADSITDDTGPELMWVTGFTLAGVHDARFDRVGVITGGDADGLELTGTSWTETLRATVEWRASDWFADRFTDIPERLVETIDEIDPDLDDTSPALLHGDLSRINVHLDPNGLLDWERALVGDPAFDLVDAESHLIDQVDVDEGDRPVLSRALHAGYRERAGSLPATLDDYRSLYWALSHLLVPQTFEEWAPTVDRPTDELASDVREEFDSRLAAAREALT
ncbi:MAG: phosphotransferase family protein [Halopenitus sp.]